MAGLPVRVHVREEPGGRWGVWVEIPERWERRGTYRSLERALSVARFEARWWRAHGHPVRELRGPGGLLE